MNENEQKKEKKHRFLFLKIFGSILLFFCMLLFIAILIPQLVRMGLHASPFQVLDEMGFYKSASRFDANIKTVGENEEEKENSQTDHFNRWELKDYILLHAEEDHLYLIHVLLPLTEGYVPGS